MNIFKKISFRLATRTLLVLLSCLLIFHSAILLQCIPFADVWGGRLKSLSEMRVFESVAIAINLLMLFLVAGKARLLKTVLPVRVQNGGLYFLALFFCLNTVGNLLSTSLIEALVFTPLTLLSAVLFLRIAVE